jgi:hypothetical protein
MNYEITEPLIALRDESFFAATFEMLGAPG